MKICKICNQVIQDDDDFCPRCSTKEAVNEILSHGETIFEDYSYDTKESSKPEDLPADQPGDVAAPLSQPKGQSTPGRQKKIFRLNPDDSKDIQQPPDNEQPLEQQEQQEWINSIKSPLLETTHPNGTINFDLPEEYSAKGRKRSRKADSYATSSFSVDSATTKLENLDENAGQIEREIAAQQDDDFTADDRSRLNKFGVSIIAILIIAVIICSGLLAVRFWSTPEADQEEYYLEKLKGTWVSDTFVYASDEEGQYPIVEYLIIRADSTFTLSYLAVDSERPRSYADWQVVEQLEGRIEISVEDLSLMFIYEYKGQMVGYRRELVQLEKEEMTLREYYDAERKSSYDIHLTRLAV